MKVFKRLFVCALAASVAFSAVPAHAEEGDTPTNEFVTGMVVGGIVGGMMGYQAGKADVANQRNEGFLEGYGAGTGMTPGPFEVEFDRELVVDFLQWQQQLTIDSYSSPRQLSTH